MSLSYDGQGAFDSAVDLKLVLALTLVSANVASTDVSKAGSKKLKA
ncbi:MAG: hypothetical protein WCI87_05055 [Euryarchaeota archaeon]